MSLVVRCTLLLLWFCWASGAFAAESSRADLPGPIQAELLRVIDGDTVEVRARIWLDLDLTTRVRLAGIDAPELNGACAEERHLAEGARGALAKLLGAGPVWLAGVQRDKYGGRVVADILTQDGRSASAVMLASDLAVRWDAAAPWCSH